jgi:hypothetical protein
MGVLACIVSWSLPHEGTCTGECHMLISVYEEWAGLHAEEIHQKTLAGHLTLRICS